MLNSDVLFISLDSCRYDTFYSSWRASCLPNISSVGPVHKAQSPSYLHMVVTPLFGWALLLVLLVLINRGLIPKLANYFRMSYSGHVHSDKDDSFFLQGSNIVDGFRKLGYQTIGSGAVDWFNPSSDTGRILSTPFEHFYYAGNTWSLQRQLSWIESKLSNTPIDQPRFVFLNVGETHVPYWHEGAEWDPWPSPCIPFGGDNCDASESSRRQRLCLEWVDKQLITFLNSLIV